MGKRRNKCSYLNCNNCLLTNPDIRLFRFPSDVDRCRIWIYNSGLGNTKLAELSAEQLNRQKVLCSEHFRDKDYANPLGPKKKLDKWAVPVPFDTPGQSDDGDDSRLSPAEFNIQMPVRTYKPVFSQPSTTAAAPSAKPKTSSLTSVSLRHLGSYRRKVVTLESKIRKKDGLLRRHHETVFRLREELGKFSRYYTTVIWKTSDRDLALRIYYKSPRIYRYLKDIFVMTDLTRKTKSVSNRVARS